MIKKLSYVFSLIVLVSGCTKFEFDDSSVNNVDSIAEDLPKIIYASVANDDAQAQEPQTRTYVDGSSVLWHNGDAISYFAGSSHNVKYELAGEGGVSSAEFSKVNGTGTTSGLIMFSRGIYPYHENNTVEYKDGVDNITVTYPAAQTYAQNSFGRGASLMVATGANTLDDKLFFRNASGYLVIKLYGEGIVVKNIKLSSLTGLAKIAGSALIVTDENNIPVVTMSDSATSEVTLDCYNNGNGIALGADQAHATEFWFALPPVEIEGGIKILVTDIYNQTFTKITTKNVNISRNDIQPMKALEFVSDEAASKRLWYTKAEEGTEPLKFYDNKTNPFNATIKEHKFDAAAGKFVIEFNAPLTTIKAEAFRETKLATIALPEGITTIENGAFWGSNLTEITIPGSVTKIGKDAFYECFELNSVTFEPSSVNAPLNIGYGITTSGGQIGPFYYSPLTSINCNREFVYTKGDDTSFTPDEWDEGIFAIDKFATVGPVSVSLGSQVQTISAYMFNKLPIESITIPASVTTIGMNAFDGCSALHTLVFEEGAASIEIWAQKGDYSPFYDSPLTTIEYNRNVIYKEDDGDSYSPNDDDEGIFCINPSFINNITGTSTVVIGKYIETIPDRAFCYLPITELTIPGTVTTIGNDVFNGCTRLSKLTFEASTASEPVSLFVGYNFDNVNESLFYCSPLTSVNLNRDIVYDTSSARITPDQGLFVCQNSKNLTQVTIGDKVRTLPAYMFYNTGLTSIDLKNITKIGYSALSYTPITSITIPSTVNEIGEEVFLGCTNLETVIFNASETILKIGRQYQNGPFYGTPLKTLVLNRNLNYNGLTNEETSLFSHLPSLANVTLGTQVKNIVPYAFANSGVTSITIPGSVTEIGDCAFYNCNSLSSVTFNAGSGRLTMGFQDFTNERGPFYQSPLTYINLDREIALSEVYAASCDSDDEGVFSNKHGLTTEVHIGNNAKTICKYMFSGVGVEELSINAGILSIDDYAFHNCTKLSRITFESGTQPLTIGFQPTTIGDETGPFYQSPLSYISLDREIVASDTYKNERNSWDEGVFATKHYDNTNLTTIVILGNNVKTISDYMFSGVRMENMTIPASVTSIGTQAFYDCRVLNHVKCLNAVPPTMGTDVFTKCSNLGDANSIAVPSASLSAYQEATNWSAYSGKMYGFGNTNENFIEQSNL